MNRARFSRVRAVLFDLDGTLLDSAPDLGAAAEAMRHARGLPPLSLQAYRSSVGSGARGMLKVAFEMGSEDTDYEAMKTEFLARYEGCMTQRTQPFDGVAPTVQALKAAGLPWGVVTNKAERFGHPLTRAMRLFDDAAALVCGDTTPHTKPHPAPLHEAARRLAVPPEHCVYVGDDERDIIAGKAAGMLTVAAQYGYLGPGADVSTWQADAWIAHPAELLKLLDLP